MGGKLLSQQPDRDLQLLPLRFLDGIRGIAEVFLVSRQIFLDIADIGDRNFVAIAIFYS